MTRTNSVLVGLGSTGTDIVIQAVELAKRARPKNVPLALVIDSAGLDHVPPGIKKRVLSNMVKTQGKPGLSQHGAAGLSNKPQLGLQALLNDSYLVYLDLRSLLGAIDGQKAKIVVAFSTTGATGNGGWILLEKLIRRAAREHYLNLDITFLVGLPLTKNMESPFELQQRSNAFGFLCRAAGYQYGVLLPEER